MADKVAVKDGWLEDSIASLSKDDPQFDRRLQRILRQIEQHGPHGGGIDSHIFLVGSNTANVTTGDYTPINFDATPVKLEGSGLSYSSPYAINVHKPRKVIMSAFAGLLPDDMSVEHYLGWRFAFNPWTAGSSLPETELIVPANIRTRVKHTLTATFDFQLAEAILPTTIEFQVKDDLASGVDPLVVEDNAWFEVMMF